MQVPASSLSFQCTTQLRNHFCTFPCIPALYVMSLSNTLLFSPLFPSQAQNFFSATSRFPVSGWNHVLNSFLLSTKTVQFYLIKHGCSFSTQNPGRTHSNTTHQLFLQCTISRRCASPGRPSPPPGCSGWAPERAEAPPRTPPAHAKICQRR